MIFQGEGGGPGGGLPLCWYTARAANTRKRKIAALGSSQVPVT
jgi:hypothetical protein